MKELQPIDAPIEISVSSQFLEDHSEPENGRYAFAYTVSITNQGAEPVRLLTRHWVITDGNNERQEVHGEGVVGEQPYIPSGDTYEYTSGALIRTAIGTMEGSYQMITDTGEFFDAPIPRFSLIRPGCLH